LPKWGVRGRTRGTWEKESKIRGGGGKAEKSGRAEVSQRNTLGMRELEVEKGGNPRGETRRVGVEGIFGTTGEQGEEHTEIQRIRK